MKRKKQDETALSPQNNANTTLLVPSKLPLVGQENISKEDIILPRLRLLQPMSEEVVENKYPAGSFVNSLTGENMNFLDILIFYFFKSRVMFGATLGEDIRCMSLDGKRSLEGRDCSECSSAEWGQDQSPECSISYNFPCLILNSQTPTVPSTISLKRTSVSQAKQLISTISLAHMQWWSIIYHVSSEKKKNAKGQFYVFKISRQIQATPEQQEMAMKYYQELSGKSIRVHEDQKDDFRKQEGNDIS